MESIFWYTKCGHIKILYTILAEHKMLIVLIQLLAAKPNKPIIIVNSIYEFWHNWHNDTCSISSLTDHKKNSKQLNAISVDKLFKLF